MAKTFDYETAWLEVALSAFKRLSGAVHLALAETVSAAGALSQLSDCSMPWPEDGGKLRALFDRIDSAELAIASQTIHNYGHWWPGAPLTDGAPDLPGREIGGHWKFSHYADQVLRERAALPARGAGGRERGWGFAVHEGMIRLTWSDARSWHSREIAPATPEGLEQASQIRARIQAVIDSEQPDRRCTNDRGNIRYREMEKIARPDKGTDLYMIDEAGLSARKAARMPEPDRDKLKAEKIADRDKTIRIAEVQCKGYCWLIDHKFPTENAIFYSHTGRWAFGWRREIPADLKSRMLDQLSEFPGEYDFVEPRQ